MLATVMELAPSNRSATPAQFHQLLTLLLVAAFAMELALFFNPLNLGNWPEAVLLLIVTFGTLTALAQQLPLQNVLLAASGIAFIGGVISALGSRSGIPFGSFTFGDVGGPQFFKTLPWPLPLLWIVIVLNSRGVARLILRPWRKIKTYGFWLIGFTAALTLLFDLAFDPFASRVKHYWFWMPVNSVLKPDVNSTPTWFGAPLVNFVSWGAVTLLMLAFVTPALIRKKPGRRSPPDYHPLGVWLGAILVFAIACAQHKLWLAVAADAVIGIVTAIFAVRGAIW